MTNPYISAVGTGCSNLRICCAGKMDLLGFIKLDPEDQQEVRKIFREYLDVFAKDDLDLGQTSVIKDKITLKEGAKPIKECCMRIQPGLYDEVSKTPPENG